ncbi:putative ATP-dependent RNA helicase SUB2 [Rhizoctonia solani 123E]|uniref:Putative ATP-dependent RNA helicase SUB2 n=1 Tax=Rhizoctonia solani 123E TaxID=1423351 RepID=A0A074S671_9AGAM|nr:putative ATP-dependent RNA helicase SUB2 [Rhizoctonia solani 123E]
MRSPKEPVPAAPIQGQDRPKLGPLLPVQHHDTMVHSRSAYTEWGDDEDEDSMAAVKWISPEPNAVLVSGNKLVATWSTPARPIVSPSFQLCLAETEECGDTVWPKVKKLPNSQYTITILAFEPRKIPQLGSGNNFFVRMVDDKGSVYDTPEFKLQGNDSPSSAVALDSGSSSPSSVLPDSLTSAVSGSTPSSAGHQGSDGVGSNSSPLSSLSPSSDSEGESKGIPQLSNEGADRSAPNNTGKGSGPMVNGTAAMSISRNSALASATGTISSTALAPSITNNALIGSPNDSKPSTAAIVVPLAIFAAALAGLLFSLRQRSKAKEIRGPKNESALNRVTSKDSCATGSTGDSGPSRTDLERAMEFIARVRAPQSPQLTPLPPSIEPRWRERREIRMRQSNASFTTEVSPESRSIPTSSSAPDMGQRIQQRNGPLPPIPGVAELDPTDMYPQSEIPRSTSYLVAQSHPPEFSQTVACQLPAPTPVENSVYPPTHYLGPSYETYPNAPDTYAISAAHLPMSFSMNGMPRPPHFVQPQLHVIPSSVSQPSIATGSIRHFASITPAPIPDSTLPPPATLRAPLPRPPVAPVPEIVINPGYLEPQPRPQPEYQPVDPSPTGPRPVIPYSTRPQTIEPEVNAVLNPYDAIAKALRTPRLG